MNYYKFLEHSADIKIKGVGRNFKQALSQVFYAVRKFLTSKNNFKIKKSSLQKIKIKEKGENEKELVFNFFVALIAECDIRQSLPIYLKIKKYQPKKYEIEAEVYLSNKIKQKDQIKAVTYHDLEVKKQKSKISITIIFDV
ncbi:MAG: archease [Candidatus Micrarchaeota archaeon]|nr:archease [Candidatus Micrarchaeota archaeon]